MLSFAKEVFLTLFFRILYQPTHDATALGQRQALGVGFVAAFSSPGERETSTADVSPEVPHGK